MYSRRAFALLMILIVLSPPPAQSASAEPVYQAISAAGGRVCALRTSGIVACWGDDRPGYSPPADLRFSQISAANQFACGILLDATVRCWGRPDINGPFFSNDYGQADPPSGTFTQLSSNEELSCGVRTDGTLTCWGFEVPGKLSPPPGQFTQVTVGEYHACALKPDTTAVCWGFDNHGETSAPDGGFIQLTLGNGYSCGLRPDGTVACWGSILYPEYKLPDLKYRSISTAGNLTCGIDQTDQVICRGYNGYYGHSYGALDPLIGQFTQVSSDGSYKCALRRDGTISCNGETPPLVPNIAVQLTGQPKKVSNEVRLVADNSLRVTAGGGTGSYTFQLISGTLPRGLELHADGSVSGTTDDTSVHYVEIQATDTQQVSGAQWFWINGHHFYLPQIAS